MALDLSAPKSPPSKPAAKSGGTSAPKVQRKPEEVYSGRMKACVDTLEAAAGLGAMFGLHADAGLIMMHGGGLADAVVTVADEHEKVGDFIDILGKNSVWTKLIGVSILFGSQLLVNHGIIKDYTTMGNAGVVSPETLIAISKAKMAEIEMEALRAKQQADQRLAQMQAQARQMYQPEVIDGEYVDAR